MTMSKQDFEVIAERIYTAFPDPDTAGSEHHRRNAQRNAEGDRERLAAHFADALAATNGMFQRDKFIRACTTGAGIRRSILPRP